MRVHTNDACTPLVRVCFVLRSRQPKVVKVDPNVWTAEEKSQLAEAIDMYGVADAKRLATRVPTKKLNQVVHMLRVLRQDNRKLIKCHDMEKLSFVELNGMNDLFLAGGTKPKEVMMKWMEFLETFYSNDPFQFDKFKLFSSAFLIMSECTPSPPPKTVTTVDDLDHHNNDGRTCDVDFK